MKKYFIILIISILSLTGKTQIIFETQQQVDSFVVVMDTSINNYYHFYYDDLLPESERITDLSGFDEDGWMYIKLFYFEIADIPWFKSFHQGQIHFVNMPNLKTFSGLKNINRSLVGINNCPSLKSFPPSGFFQYNSELWISNQDMEQFELNFKDVSENPRGGRFSNRVYFYDNKIKRLIINDPNGAAGDLSIVNDSSLRYLDLNLSSKYQSLDLKDNILLDSIRGQMKNLWIVPGIYDNPILKDLCVLRDGIDAYYQNLNQRDKDNFNTSDLKQNGKGASTYEEMMATDCSWLADTFTTVAEKKGISHLQLYPNPVSRSMGSVTLEIGSDKTLNSLHISNLRGQHVYASERNTNISLEIDISDFAIGLYVLHMVDVEGLHTKKKLVVVD